MKQDIDMTWDEFRFQKEHRLLSMSGTDEGDKETFINLIKSQRSLESYLDIKDFADKIENHEYDHGLLSKAQYLAHPYRVATLLALHVPGAGNIFIKLALCHNVIEVSELSPILVKNLGPELLRYVEILTVDRSQQWDGYYKEAYYRVIAQEKVTIFDKLDNMFILSENTDLEVKVKYLEEIEKHLMPFVVKDVPSLKETFDLIIRFNYELIGKNI